MVDLVGEQCSSWAESPARFEAGSPNFANAIGFAAAADYLSTIGMAVVKAHVGALTQLAARELAQLPGLQVLPRADIAPSGALSFEINGVHPHDIVQIAGERGVALRAGHHCCQPLMQHLGVAATTRASFGLYNHPGDLQAMLEAIEDACRLFR
jgi:cysteine desulfurase/selenocysteine lyase